MSIEEFYKWLDKECLNNDGTQYLRPEFLWFNEAHNFYEDVVMCKPVFTPVRDGCFSIRTYWDIQFMISPYANREEIPHLIRSKEIAFTQAENKWRENYSTDDLKNTPVEFWFRVTETELVRIKITPFGKPGEDIPNIRKFLIEYDI